MTVVRRLVVDVMIPHNPSIVAFTDEVAEADGVDAVTSSLVEFDQEVQNVQVALEGEDVDVDSVEQRIESLGGAVHSVDQVSCGKHVAPTGRTPQDD